jgi:hypothetical protein
MFWSCDHALLLGLLSEGSIWIFVLPVGVFPELADKGLALLLVAALFPVRDDFLFQYLLRYPLPQRQLSKAIEALHQHNIGKFFSDVVGLL